MRVLGHIAYGIDYWLEDVQVSPHFIGFPGHHVLVDNQKVNGYLGPYRFLRFIVRPSGHPEALAFLKGRIDNALGIVDKRLTKASFILGEAPTIVDISLVGYFYYPAEEFGFDIAAEHKNIAAWLDRIKTLPGWKPPYQLMPGHPLPGR